MCVYLSVIYTFHYPRFIFMGEIVLLPLPPVVELETKAVLRKVAAAHRYLAEL